MGALEVPEIARTYVEAWASLDLEGWVAAYAPDGTLSDPNTPGPLAGAELEEYAKRVFARYPDAQYEVLSLDAISEEVCVCRWMMRATHTGSTGGVPATGRRVTLPMCEFITIRGGKIHHVEGYFDRLTVLQQLGLSPEQLGLQASS